MTPPGGLRDSQPALVVSALARTVLGALVLLVLVSVVPAAAGWQSTVVMSGSMAPSVEPGDVTLVRPVDAAALEPGQVLLVDDPDVPGGLRLHRLVAVTDVGLQLKGDANATPDGSLVDAAAVHGVGALRLPGLGLPVVWASEGRWVPLSGAVLALTALLGLALLHRSSDDDEPTDPPGRARSGAAAPPARTAVRATTAVLAVAVLVTGTASAAFSGRTTTASSVGTAPYFTCAAAASGETAAQYLALQETTGTVAYNRGTYSGNGTYAGGVTLGVPGPVCNSASGAVRLDGSSGFVHTPINVSNPQTFSTQLWFTTTTGRGGYLVGFGNGTNGDTSSTRDRLVYMTNAGRLTFGVYDGTPQTITTPGSYNDGRWHQVTATFSPWTGARLYVDGKRVATNASMNAAEAVSGFFRAGYDSLSGWPDPPTSPYFAGSIAHLGIYASALTDAEVAAQYGAAN
ncbi:LamG-like jellyroll fold domain-containing protein [Modestobacter sp. SSW1-42]|uniref:LamG-like jellyroll fold domain-containing protein n=1 Tax=Modestobacter sp. SSW1-42 TaxID=596372 RepID=UPI0039888FEE